MNTTSTSNTGSVWGDKAVAAIMHARHGKEVSSRHHVLLHSPQSVIDYRYNGQRIAPPGTRKSDMPTPEDAAQIIAKHLQLRLGGIGYEVCQVSPILAQYELWPSIRMFPCGSELFPVILDRISHRKWARLNGTKTPEYDINDAVLDARIKWRLDDVHFVKLLPKEDSLRQRIERRAKAIT